ncbi:dicer-2 protein [Dichotomocladium elegans]|nr:dicer-2 protein [Dichotomocladium elegans]
MTTTVIDSIGAGSIDNGLVPRGNLNDIDRDTLSRYVDPAFLNIKPDEKARTEEQALALELEDLEDDVDSEDAIEGSAAQRIVPLEPREYQYELYRKACEENVIAVLDTGSGKTLIAVMLIKYIADREREERQVRRNVKLTFFLVDRVPLVFQQADVIRSNCDVNIEHMCGQMNVDSWTQKKWRQIFEENDTCVMTAQIFLDTLRHGFIHLEEVNLIIFDECHHATKRHPYNLIMQEFYFRCEKDKRPKIFGMTASPMHAKSGVQYSAIHLEKNLDSRIYTASNIEQLLISVNRPKEITVEYANSQAYDPTPLTVAIQDKIGTIKRFRRCFQTSLNVLEHLGPWCCDKLWHYMLEDVDERITMDTEGLDSSQLMDEDRAVREAFELTKGVISDNPDVTSNALFTGKVQKFMLVLKTLSTLEDFCGIIFVERRHTAISLHLLISAISELKNKIRSDILIGHGSTDEGDVQMKFRDQNKVIERFRKGELNLLIATNVAEEGLDIQPCNVVIRFDFFSTLIGYIQSRGRARKPNSKYIIMVEKNSFSQISRLNDFRRLETDMRTFCQALPEERNLALRYLDGVYADEESDDSDDYYDDLDGDAVDEFNDYIYIVATTGATITMHSAVPLLHRYCGSLPSDSFCVLKPVFEIFPCADGFTCKVSLPSNAAVREVESPIARTKARAKRIAAFEVCKELHRKGVLNDHLMPNSSRREILGEMGPQYDENGQLIGSRRRKNIFERRTPRFWEREPEVEEEIPEEDEVVSTEVKNASRHTTEVATTSIGLHQDPLVPEKVSNGNISTEHTEEVKAEGDPPDIGEGPFDMSVTTINMHVPENVTVPVRRLVILTWKPLPTIPEFELYSKGRPFKVSYKTDSEYCTVDRETVETLAAFTLRMTSTITNREFSCPLYEFPYFIAPLKIMHTNDIKYVLKAPTFRESVDWDEVHRVIEYAFIPVDADDPGANLQDRIIIDFFDNSRRYIVRDICANLHPTSAVPADMNIRETGYETFAAYYQDVAHVEITKPDQPLLRVQRINKVMNYLFPHESASPIEKKRTATFVIPEFCRLFPISASVYQSAMFLPSFMTRLDSYLLIQEAKKRYDLPSGDDMLLEAYTTPSASMSMNYERLETLGDSLLKFLATIRLIINFPYSNEGELHCLRIRVICNRALYRAAKRLKLYRYVTSHAFNRRYWRPHHFVTPNDTPETLKEVRQHSLSDKTLADIVEASLGACYLSSGLRGGLQCAIQMQIPFDEIKSWDDFNDTWLINRDKMPARAEITSLRQVNVRRVEEVTGYTFKNPLLIVEALTHASLPNSTAPCYQRLEFLGDAILDFLVIRYLFTKYPEADPGQITELKDSCVNNHVLGIICVENDLHKNIKHYSGRLVKAIEEFCLELEEVKNKGDAQGEYWRDMSIPKVLSDVVESMLGAVFIDAGFDLDPVEKVFEKWMVPLFEKHVSPDTIHVHPLRKLTTGLQAMGCDGFMLRNFTSESNAKDSQKCVIFLHDQPLASGSSDNIKAARRNAATKANLRLEEDPDLVERVCDCGILDRRRNKAYVEDEDEE